MSEKILDVQNISVHYGRIQAIHGLSIEMKRGEMTTLIGANGSGKTTILRALSGLVRPSSGQIFYQGESLSGLKAHQIIQRGMSHVPEGRGIFLNMTVEENLELGSWVVRYQKKTYSQDLDTVFQLFPRLKERRSQNAGTLSGGEQQMLAIGRALMARPQCLLLDEPSLGLAPQIIEKIFEIIQKINQQGVTILLVEQNALQALKIAHRGIVLETGKVALTGSAQELLISDAIRRIYLGG